MGGRIGRGRTGPDPPCRVDHRDGVVVRRFRIYELAGEVAGEVEDLAGVAVVEAEDGGGGSPISDSWSVDRWIFWSILEFRGN